jgi:hypothetical protein
MYRGALSEDPGGGCNRDRPAEGAMRFMNQEQQYQQSTNRRINVMKNLLSTLTFAVAGLVLSWSASADDLTGKTAFVQTNIWFEKPMKILATNYHTGNMIAPGTKVTIEEIDEERIVFKDDAGTKYRIVIELKHNNVPGPKLAERLFSAEDPMAGRFQKFTKEEQDNIKAGYVVKGMSKEAVLMAYGYPPTIRTPNTDSNIWTYWKNRWVTQIIRFDDKGKVSDIQG